MKIKTGVNNTDGSETVKVHWEKTMTELFEDGWLESPTQAMIINMNILNEASNCLMLFRLIAIKTEAGLYELDFQTSIANIRFFKTRSQYIQAVCIILLDVLLVTMALYEINTDFKMSQSVNKLRRVHEEAEK